MSTAQSLVAILRCHIDRDHDRAERLIAELDPYAARMALRESTVLLAQAIVHLERNDRHAINEHLAGLGLAAAQQSEAS